MKMPSFLTLLLAGLLSLTAFGAADKTKKIDDLSDYPFWTGKKTTVGPPFVPGLNAVLLLTDDQKQQIAAARDEMANDEGVKAARSLSKNDPSVTAVQREKARATMEAATTRLRERVATILTPEQKALIEKINAAYTAAVEEAGIIYADKFASVKADEAARRRIQEEKNQDTEEQFLQKLDGILNASQREAMTRAAEEAQRRAGTAALKKPVK
jgi:hypothetical protein